MWIRCIVLPVCVRVSGNGRVCVLWSGILRHKGRRSLLQGRTCDGFTCVAVVSSALDKRPKTSLCVELKCLEGEIEGGIPFTVA